MTHYVVPSQLNHYQLHRFTFLAHVLIQICTFAIGLPGSASPACVGDVSSVECDVNSLVVVVVVVVVVVDEVVVTVVVVSGPTVQTTK